MTVNNRGDFAHALLGGVWGGAVAGLGEAALIAATAGELPELSFFPYAVIGYALLGGLAGVGIGVGHRIACTMTSRVPGAFGSAAGLPLAGLVFVVGRYHVNQRLFHEELSVRTAGGAVAYAALALAAFASLLLALWVGRRLSRHRVAMPLASVALVGLVAVAVAVGASRTATDTVTGPRPARRADAARPNVIMIIADTLRADAVSAQNPATAATPAMDALAADGTRFERTYTQSSWTRPSIATILTSLHPSSHGAVHKTSMLPDSVVTVAEAYRNAGYWTAAFVSNINVAPIFNFHQGFSEYTYLSPDFYFWARDSAARLALYRMLRVLRERFFANRIYAANFYQDAVVVTERALRWLEHAPPQPFFLLVHYMDPHDPYFEIPYDGRGIARVTTPNPPVARREELHKLYLDNVRFFDQHLAQLSTRLKTLGLYDDSVIALTADHGEAFYEHGGWWHGTTLYEEEVLVPLILKRPRQAGAGTVVAEPVQTIDIAPTLLAATGIAPPPGFEGIDLFGADQQPAVFVAEENLEGNVLASIRIGPWKLITANADNPRGLRPLELYHLDRDPHEQHDVADDEPERVQEMIAALARARSRGSRGGAGG